MNIIFKSQNTTTGTVYEGFYKNCLLVVNLKKTNLKIVNNSFETEKFLVDLETKAVTPYEGDWVTETWTPEDFKTIQLSIKNL